MGGTRYPAEKRAAWQRANIAANPLTYRLIQLKSRAKDTMVRFDPRIRSELEAVPRDCPLCGIAMKKQEGSAQASSPSVDKILPDLGYVPGNVRWICFGCNRRKGDSVRDFDVLGFLLNRSAYAIH